MQEHLEIPPPRIYYLYRISLLEIRWSGGWGTQSWHQKSAESSHPPKPNLKKAKLKALTELRKDSNRILLTADKGVAMIVMDRKDYIEKATNLLSQTSL